MSYSIRMPKSTGKKYLVVVESPGKIQKIQKILSKLFPKDQFIVKASYGHIIDLDRKKMSVDIEDSFEPSYYPIDSKKKEVIRILRATSKKVDEVLIATDEDREGEMIGWSIAEELKLKNPKRIVFNSITEKELKKAVENPTVINEHMVNSQKARRVLDRIVGFEISPILWKSARQSLSAGRVQSVVVELITDKEKEVKEFMKNKLASFYKVDGKFKFKQNTLGSVLMRNKDYGVESSEYSSYGSESESETESETETETETESRTETESESGTGSESESSEEDTAYKGVKAKIEDRNVAKKLMNNISKSTFTVANVTKKNKTRRASPPFTTSTLQQEAARKLGYSIKSTMSSAQKLYEAGLITYMRTDSVNLSKEALGKIAKFIKKKYGDGYLNMTNYKSRSKNTQEAHEAIRPSDIDKRGITMKGKISSSEVSLYNLIWKRTVASQMKPAEFKVTSIDVDISKVNEYYFSSSIDELIFPGFLAVYNYKNINNSADEIALSVPKKGDKLQSKGVVATQDYNRPPPRYSEASLVNKLDPKNLNIGRPSTYSSIIDKIQSKNYVKKDNVEGIKKDVVNYTWDGSSKKVEESDNEVIIGKENNKLLPTDIGIMITKFLVEYFPDLMKYDFTSNMESDLDKIAEGSIKWTKVLKNFYNKFHPLVQKAGAKDINLLDAEERKIGKDPKTKNTLVASIGPYGHYVKMVNSDGKATKSAPIRKPYTKDTITLKAACELFEWPKILGHISRKKVKFYNAGRYGPYVTVGANDKFSLKFTEDFKQDDVDLEYVKGLVKEREKNNLWTAKEGDYLYTVLNGPYGKYVSIKNTKVKKKAYNVSLPDDIDLKDMTVVKMNDIIEERKKNRYKKRQAAKKGGAERPTAKKAPAKKPAAKKKTPAKRKPAAKKRTVRVKKNGSKK